MGTHGLISAFCKGRELQKQIRERKENPDPNAVDIWWLAQSGFLVHWNGTCVLFDPYLSDSLTKKYATTQKPHVRMSELVIAPEWLDQIDIVTSSHNHTDHLDADTLKPLLRVNPEIAFVIPEANRAFVCERVGCPIDLPIGLNEGETKEVKGITFHGVPAAHNTIERDEAGRCKFMGFVIRLGRWTFYHSGDTLWYEGIVETLRAFQPDVAFLPINGNDPSRGVAGNLDAREAAELGVQIGARLVIPHHFHLFEFNTADPTDFSKIASALKQPVKVLRLGEHLAFS